VACGGAGLNVFVNEALRSGTRISPGILSGWSARCFLSPAQRRLFARGVPVFMYHKVAVPPKTTRDPFLYARPGEFGQQLAALREAGYSTTRLDQVVKLAANDARQVVLSFDDGFRNAFENALEILSRHRFCAIQFLVSDYIGKRNEWDVSRGDVPETLMDKSQVREWLAAGHEIGSHSATHRNLKKLSASEARKEIFSSKKQLEDEFGVLVRHFSYPFGAVTEAVRDLVAEAGYETACTVQFGVNNSLTPRFELRRIIPIAGADLLRKVWHRLGRKIVGHT
jgi:peptidoglycan/xylan/chitin deacetylase (PgdA/CDA1 family)